MVEASGISSVAVKCVDIRRNTSGEGLKLKGIDGHPHKRWSMLFNSKIREEPYLGLTSR